MDSINEKIAALTEMLVKSGLANKGSISGCLASEITRLEEFFGLSLPVAYRYFLAAMGRGAGAFMQGTDVLYSSLFENRSAMDEVLKLDGNPFDLASSAFVFSCHQGYIFHFFDTAAGMDDPPVHGYREGDMKSKLVAEHFTEFLITTAEEEKATWENLSPWAKSLMKP
jgi:hypothetical protein